MGTLRDSIGLIVAAGEGRRAGSTVPKQYQEIAGKSLLAHAIECARASGLTELLVVIGPGQEALYHQAVPADLRPEGVKGGETRQQSVRNGLEAIASMGGAGTVLIHDAARPFLSAAVVQRLREALESAEAAVPVLPVVDTMASEGEKLGDIVPRDQLVRVQTPQAFRFKSILHAHRIYAGTEATDDAQIARAAGMDVVTVEGDTALEKLTYPEDFLRAEHRLTSNLVSRTGLGFDVHAFADGEELWLGGLRIPFHRGLSGHSDADVALHALTDAILGAIGEGDIGLHFPPTDPKWRGASSSMFVEHARALVEEKRGRIDHIDLTIICEAPKVGPHRDAIRENIARLLGVPLRSISVKATTTERLGFTGRGEGIAAQAVATVRTPEEE